MLRIADISWSKKLLAVSSIYILGLLSVGVVGGYTIYGQTKATEAALKVSQSRSDAASKAQVAILTMAELRRSCLVPKAIKRDELLQ